MTASRARLAALALLAACSTTSESAPALYVPDAVPVDWDRAWDGEGDGLAAVVPLEVMAYDASTGHPLADVPVSVTSLDPRAVAPVRVDHVDWDASWDVSEVDELDADELEAPVAWWDARRDLWFAVDAASAGSGADVVTDADGLARLYLVVDSLPDGPQPVTASIADGEALPVEETLVLLPR